MLRYRVADRSSTKRVLVRTPRGSGRRDDGTSEDCEGMACQVGGSFALVRGEGVVVYVDALGCTMLVVGYSAVDVEDDG